MDEDKLRGHSKQRKDYISYKNAKNGDVYDQMTNLFFFVPHKIYEKDVGDIELPRITLSYQF
jgi:hypothetical protein